MDRHEQAKERLQSGKPQRGLLNWYSAHPLIGLIGTVCSVLGLLLAITFFVTSIKSRDLSFYVNPAKITIVKSGQTSDLHVSYRARELASDVTVLQVQLWNAGRESIHPQQVLSPVLLERSPSAPILEARIRKVSRAVTDVQLDTRKLDQGRLGIYWKILEHDDGALIQLILAGPPETTVKATGTIEGQNGINAVEFDAHSIRNSVVIPTVLTLVSGAFFVPLVMSLRTKIYSSQVRHKEAAFLSGSVLLGICVMALVLWLADLLFPRPSVRLPFQ